MSFRERKDEWGSLFEVKWISWSVAHMNSIHLNCIRKTEWNSFLAYSLTISLSLSLSRSRITDNERIVSVLWFSFVWQHTENGRNDFYLYVLSATFKQQFPETRCKKSNTLMTSTQCIVASLKPFRSSDLKKSCYDLIPSMQFTSLRQFSSFFLKLTFSIIKYFPF